LIQISTCRRDLSDDISQFQARQYGATLPARDAWHTAWHTITEERAA